MENRHLFSVAPNDTEDFGLPVATNLMIPAGAFQGNAMMPAASAPTPAAITVGPSGDPRIEGLRSGFKWGTNTITYSFYAGGPYYSSQVSSPSPVSNEVKDNVRFIFNSIISPLVNLTFTEVPDTPTSYGLMRFSCTNSADYAAAWYPTSGDTNTGSSSDIAGDLIFNPGNDVTGTDFNSRNNSFRSGPGAHGFTAIIHEICHALGLKHPFDSDGSGTTLPTAENNQDNTLMTYTFVGSSPAMLMPYDVLALQYYYGPNTATRADNTTYTFTTTDTFSPGSGSDNSPRPAFNSSRKQLLWDAGGVDTLDFSGLPSSTGGYRFDLRPGGWLASARAYNSVTYSGSNRVTESGTRIALAGTVIENIVVSRYADEIYLNTAANTVSGFLPGVAGGSDIVIGANQSDTLDFSRFLRANVTEAQVANDLVVTLGTGSVVTVRDFYAVATGLRPTLLYMDPPPTASIGDVSVLEGDSGQRAATFTITLSFAPTQSAILTVATQDGSATAANGDYVPLPAGTTVTFAPGQMSATVSITVRGDTVFEPDETFTVTLSSPERVLIGDGSATCTIRNDDPVPPPNISINDVTVVEGNIGETVATMSVVLSWAFPQDVSLSIRTQDISAAAAEGDYVPLPAGARLVIPAGQTTGSVTVRVCGDTRAELSETFAVLLSNAQNGVITDDTGICTIVADDIGLASTVSYVVEGTGVPISIQVPVTIIGNLTEPLTLYYQTSSGTARSGVSQDFRDARGVLTYFPRDTEKRIAISITGDRVPEPDEEFIVRIRRTPQGLGSGAAGDSEVDLRVVIVDDDSRYFQIVPAASQLLAGNTAVFDVQMMRMPGFGNVLPAIQAGAIGLESVRFTARYVAGNAPVPRNGRWNQPGNIDRQTGILNFGYLREGAGYLAQQSVQLGLETSNRDVRRAVFLQLYSATNNLQHLAIASQTILPRNAAVSRAFGGLRRG